MPTPKMQKLLIERIKPETSKSTRSNFATSAILWLYLLKAKMLNSFWQIFNAVGQIFIVVNS